MDWILLGIPLGVIMLYYGSDWMVKGAKGLALRFGVAPFVIGLTVVAFGSSAPECITSIVSGDTPQIIIGNVVGSNIANIGLAIGLASIVGTLTAKYSTMRFESIVMLASSVLITVMAATGSIGFYEGLLLVVLLLLFVYSVYHFKKDDAEGSEAYLSEVEEDESDKAHGKLFLAGLVVVGLVLLYFGARLFIDGAKCLAELVGVSDMLIGLIVVAIGTSLPEICISMMAAHRGEADIAVANIVGSNIFNAFFVLGIGSLLTDVPIADSMLWFHMPVMLIFSVVMVLMIRTKNKISRPMGVLLVAMYAAYIAVMALNPGLTM